MDFTQINQVETELGREIVELVPHWYEAPFGPRRFSVTVGKFVIEFCNHFELSAKLSEFLQTIGQMARELPLHRFDQYPGLIDVLRESIAIEWLRLHSATIDWVRLLKYLSVLSRRTNENCPVSLNVLITEGKGENDISRPGMQKFVDHLASSPLVYMAIDSNLRLLDYAEVSSESMEVRPSSAFVPSFLQPIHDMMASDDFSAHITAQGDVIIMNREGVLAARRQGKWKVFDVHAFRRSLFECIGNEFVAGNMLDLVLELGFMRRGALFIYDPRHCMRDHILNRESIVSDKWAENSNPAAGHSGQNEFSRYLKLISLGSNDGTIGSRRRLLEIAAVDGALVFDDESLLAVGAIVESHPEVGNQLGARTTAARSSYLWGSHPMTVSSDGDISVYFESKNGDGACDAVIQF